MQNYEIIAKERQEYYDELQAAKAEIERLQNELVISQTGYVSMEGKAWELREQLKTAKAEAIKEFAERLKEKSHNLYPFSDEPIINCKDVDNLVKEMVGE